MTDRPKWYPNWQNQTVAIVASGPSALEHIRPLEEVRSHCRVVAINNSWQLVPWCEALFAHDYPWWLAYHGVPGFKGLKIMAQQYRTVPEEWNVRRLKYRYVDGLVWTPGEVGWGGGSGFQAFNWVAQTEPRQIVLVGYDLTLDHGLHWHGAHDERRGLTNPVAGKVARWRRAMVTAVEQAMAAGIDVVNCSPHSDLGCKRGTIHDTIQSRPRLEVVPVQRVRRVHRTQQA